MIRRRLGLFSVWVSRRIILGECFKGGGLLGPPLFMGGMGEFIEQGFVLAMRAESFYDLAGERGWREA